MEFICLNMDGKGPTKGLDWKVSAQIEPGLFLSFVYNFFRIRKRLIICERE